ncbi:peptidylprolyl isomerase [Ostreiculturibacter nitratireducens]|uniref:peptidylprolyl isomerase n=1 Tax=Ostreiculturibacter nitratireducens TaxID=3075226 RepID=UPI0031B59969
MAKSKKGANTVVYALLALLILGLGGFGVQNFGGSIRSIASVGDQEITVNDYARALNREMQALSQQIGQPANMAVLQAMGRDAAVRGSLIAAAAMDNEATRIGISVGDEAVRQQIVTAREFQGLTGEFDRDAYAFALRQEGLSEREFEQKLRGEASRMILQGAVVGGVAAPEAYGATLTAWATETRDFTEAELTAADLPEPLPEPTDEELQAHYEANIDAFTSLETRAITYVWLKPEALLDEVTVEEDAIKAAYEARKAEFSTPERRLVERLVFPSQEEAEAAKTRIDAGEATFTDVVTERGLTLADIDMGEVSEAELGAAGAAVFALTEPGLVGPVGTDLGPALFSMNAILSAQETTYEEAREDLEAELALDRARRLVLERSAPIEDELAGGATLEEIAKEPGMEFGTVEFDATVEDGIAGYKAFREAALAAEVGDYPDLAELEDGGVFSLRLDEIRAPAPIPLDEIRDDVVASWKAVETQKRLVALAEDYLAQLQNGATLEGLGLVVSQHTDAGRDTFIAGLTPQFISRVFETEEGAHAVVDANGVHLIRVDAVRQSDAADADVAALRASIDQQVRQSIANDIYAGYVMALQAEAGISLNPTAVEAVHAQMR